MNNSPVQHEDEEVANQKTCSLEYFCEVCEYYPLYPVHGHYECPKCFYKTELVSHAIIKISETSEMHRIHFSSFTLSLDNLLSEKINPVSSLSISEKLNITCKTSLCCEGAPQ